jgi:hypothetical protein
MHVEAASPAVQHQVFQAAFQVGLHLQQFEAQHLRVDRDRVRRATGGHRLADQIVGLGGLVGDGVDGAFKDVRERRGPL